jgi:hypothetical protein
MTVSEIKAVASKYKKDYKVVAIRTQEEPFELGNMSHLSHVWVNGDDTGKLINGICATTIRSDSVVMHSDEHTCHTGYYYGNYQAIICGNNYKYGADKGEVIISDPVVVEIITDGEAWYK